MGYTGFRSVMLKKAEENQAPEEPVSVATSTPQSPTAPKAGNIFSRHKIWWLVLVVSCLVFSLAFPPSASHPGMLFNPDFFWASVIGNCVGKFLVAFLITGSCWLLSLLGRTKATSTQIMTCFTVALGLAMVAQLVAASYRSDAGNGSEQQVQQEQDSKSEVLNDCEIFDSHLFTASDGQGGIYARKVDGRIRNKSARIISGLTLKISIYGADKARIDTKTVSLGFYPEEVAPGDVKSFDEEIYIPRVPVGFTWSYSITDVTFH